MSDKEPHSATVTVLTAEVRVLMVGSRQVTLSVFRQLDSLKYADCTPMGRVNHGPGERWIVGKSPDGNLVRARFDGERPYLTWEEQTKLAHLRERQARLAEEESRYPYLAMTDQNKADLAELEEAERNMPGWVAEYEAYLAAYKALPLIVLAGLK